MPAYKDEKRKTWYCSFYYEDWNGIKKIKKKRGFKTQRDALAFEREFKIVSEKSCDMSFESFVEIYIDDQKNRLRETTIDNKKYIIETKIKPYFNKKSIDEIDAASIRKWQNILINDEKKYSQTYLRSINNQMSAIMNYAVKYYNLPKNPVQVAGTIGKSSANEMKIWTLDEFKKFIECVDVPAFKLAFNILFWTGIRSGELLALTPADIFETKITINKSFYRKSGEDKINNTKTEAGNRIISIPTFLYNEITEYIKSLYEINSNDRIFYFSKTALNKKLSYYSKKAHLQEIRIHDLRHSHASLLIEMDEPILLVSERLGHEKVKTTLETYAHLYPNKSEELAKKLQKLI